MTTEREAELRKRVNEWDVFRHHDMLEALDALAALRRERDTALASCIPLACEACARGIPFVAGMEDTHEPRDEWRNPTLCDAWKIRARVAGRVTPGQERLR